MKQSAKVVALVAAVLFLAAPLWAKGTPGVANTIHNLSTSSIGAPVYASNTDEICVFCHTPHGGSLSGPLWNRSLPGASSFTHYNSATLSLSSLGVLATRPVNDESLLCMSCHDGSVAVDHLLNDPNSLQGTPIAFFGGIVTDLTLADGFGSPNANIGGSPSNTAGNGDLTDDHPISFSYQAVQAQSIYGTGGSRDGELRPIGDTTDVNSVLGWKNEGVRLFGSDFRVECSSCHDPHVDYVSGINAPKNYKPFLIRPNNGSDLCLACHNK